MEFEIHECNDVIERSRNVWEQIRAMCCVSLFGIFITYWGCVLIVERGMFGRQINLTWIPCIQTGFRRRVFKALLNDEF